MKEYWVNVYDKKYMSDMLGIWWLEKAKADKAKEVEWKLNRQPVHYRLHVREFETKEAKELYLKMKYGKDSFRYMLERNC